MQQQLHTAGLPASRQAYSQCYGEGRAMYKQGPSSMAELWRRSGVSVDPYRLTLLAWRAGRPR